MKRSLLLFVVASFVAGTIGLGASTSAPGASVDRQVPAPPQPGPPAETKPNDYKDDNSWLCRPGRTGDACDVDLTTTVVAADGTMTKETWAADPKAPIDCFYIY